LHLAADAPRARATATAPGTQLGCFPGLLHIRRVRGGPGVSPEDRACAHAAPFLDPVLQGAALQVRPLGPALPDAALPGAIVTGAILPGDACGRADAREFRQLPLYQVQHS